MCFQNQLDSELGLVAFSASQIVEQGHTFVRFQGRNQP